MNATVASLLAAIDAGLISPVESQSAINQAGGLVYILCNIANS